MPLNMATVRLGLIYLANHAYTLERGRTLVMLDLEHMRNFLDVTGTVVTEILDCLEGNGLIEKTYVNLCQVAKSEYYVLFLGGTHETNIRAGSSDRQKGIP